MKAELDSIFLQGAQAEWLDRFSTVECCVSPVLMPEETLQHPHFIARELYKREQHSMEVEYWKTQASLKFSQ